jgi:hypothetical protein
MLYLRAQMGLKGRGGIVCWDSGRKTLGLFHSHGMYQKISLATNIPKCPPIPRSSITLTFSTVRTSHTQTTFWGHPVCYWGSSNVYS